MSKTITCVMCGVKVVIPNLTDPNTTYSDRITASLCTSCYLTVPKSLVKASIDEFDYALNTRDCLYVRFTSACIAGQFALLTVTSASSSHTFPRGLEIRISDIVWCADAPDGS